MNTAWQSRSPALERMDDPNSSETLLFRTLDQFRLMNRLVSRYPRILESGVLKVMQREPTRPYTLVDLGAGGGDIARWLIRRSRQVGLRLTIRALDNDPRILRYSKRMNAAYPEIQVEQGNILDASVIGHPDFVFANHVLHHLSDTDGVGLLQSIAACGAQDFFLSDLIRSRGALAAYALGVAPFFHRSYLLHDGLQSIRRGFTRKECEQFIIKAHLNPEPRLTFRFPFRFIISRSGAV